MHSPPTLRARAHFVLSVLQGAKLYFKHQVYGTRPNPKRGKNAVVRVQNLETGEKFKINTEHAVLNVPTEASHAAMHTGCFCDGCLFQYWEGGRGV